MLYDPKWEKTTETKADPFSLDSLTAWLEMMPADKTYCYMDNGMCLLSQYFTAAGFRNVCMFGHAFYHGNSPIPDGRGERSSDTRLPPWFNEIAVNGPWTFGAALKRARRYL